MLNNKRGVSPLIATILLLAFVVSLITVIIQLNPFSNECGKINIQLQELDGKKRICYNEQNKALEMYIQNADYPLGAIKVTVHGSKDTMKIANYMVSIPNNRTQKVEIPYDSGIYGDIIDVTIKSKISIRKDILECPLKDNIDTVRAC